VGQGLLAELGGAGRAEQLSHYCRSKPTFNRLISCLQFERLIFEIVVCGLCKWWGSMPCDLLSSPILAENTLVHLGSNAFQCPFGLKDAPKLPSQKVPEI
jgi:hypothetical protein